MKEKKPEFDLTRKKARGTAGRKAVDAKSRAKPGKALETRPGSAVLKDLITGIPPVRDRAAATARVEECLAELEKAHPLRSLLAEEKSLGLATALAAHSPYLWQLCAANPERFARLLTSVPERALSECLNLTQKVVANSSDEAEVMSALRRMKQETHLLIALADLAGIWTVETTVRAISDMADCAVSSAMEFLLRAAERSGKLVLPHASDPQKDCGVVVLALGKHGARELNYSSDVDLIVFYDAESPALPDPLDAAPLFVRITRHLVKLLQERTEDGYVLRVDLRLRPDPGSTSVAISVPAAFDYYETVGQNWERAAYIKARAVAGDIALGERFIEDLAPFIWRKYFDYAAIADIHAMKRQIHAVRGHGRIAIAGHDIKLGRGGIREVEFFVQTQQLIFGGRRPQLRGRQTLEMLPELEKDGWITSQAVGELSAAYRFLRTIEHRLQMRIDEQTQRLPADESELDDFAMFCGFSGVAAFSSALLAQMGAVETHYARLFENAPTLSAAIGSLVFTGSLDDPGTIETLQKLGFRDPSKAIETVRGWHFGRRSAIQSARAREVLTELTPSLIEAFSGSGDPDAALAAFDEALGHMPASVELLSILKSNASVRELFGDILGGAPRLAQVVTQRPHVLDAAIDPALLGTTRDEAYFESRAARVDTQRPDTEPVLDAMRDIALEESFLIGVRIFSGAIDAGDAGAQYSGLAASLVRTALDHVEFIFKQEYGAVPGGRCAVLGLGKLGSREMTATSDLDLILLYDFDESEPYSDGQRSIHANQYYARIAQRLVSALTVPTRRGPLYEVDMRLRPSGRQGPVATNIRSFREYQLGAAETWEHMALSRARHVAGSSGLGYEASQVIEAALCIPRDGVELANAVKSMRELIAAEKGDSDPWDLKLVAGGLIDIEFTAQFICLKHAHAIPGIHDVNTGKVVEAAVANGALDVESGRILLEAYRFYSAIMQTQKLAIDGTFVPETTASGVLRRLAGAVNLPDFKTVEREVESLRKQVRATYLTIVQ
ncbi:MAG: bifunctional [glutamine synthetase] adenylyltransferase/[glutamine synthetase]-adenylyl-L-tyrosine phosphorylase [Beijerinckiaceae bacterium]